jgi:hypothetical protein
MPNEIFIEAMIKGLRLEPTAQYFARKPPQTLEKLLQKMDEHIRADNDFRQRREEAYRFSEMTRGFGGRIHPRHVRSIHNSSQSDDRGSQLQRPQHSSQSSGQQQSSFRPPAPRDRGGRGFGGRYGDQPRKLYCLFCGEDKGYTTRTCQVTIQKQKEIAEAEAWQNQPKQVLHTASCYSPYVPEFMRGHPLVFAHSSDPMDAEDWLRTVERELHTAQCDDREKDLYGLLLLRGADQSWWESYLANHANLDTITWVEFKDNFCQYHVPVGLMTVKKEVFLALKQGPMSVSEYRDRFLQLSRYAPEDVNTDAKRHYRFL